jgi:opacity protein-like surface antigen
MIDLLSHFNFKPEIMKKSALMILVLVVIGTTSAFSQWQFGGGLALGTKSSGDGDPGFGINARADYAIDEQWAISPNFALWFPSVDGYSITMWQLNADAHYIFSGDESLNFYGIGGLNYSYWKFDFDGGESFFDYDDNEIGLNLGVGANMNMFFGELKYDTAFEQIAITVGVLF